MRIIDKTPFQNDKGVVDALGRIQGTLKYGPSWYPELQAQQAVIAQLDRLFEKGYALIRNFILPGSEVIVPMILLAPSKIFVIYVTHLKGFYEAKGDQWNKLDQGRSLAAPRNLLLITSRLTQATKKYLEIQGIKTALEVEPILMAADPGLNIDSMRAIIRVIKSDAINQFAATVLSTRAVIRNEQVYDLAERIVTPREGTDPLTDAPDQPPSRAKAIFDAAKPDDLAFALDDEDHIAPNGLPPGPNESAPYRSLPETPAAPRKKLILGMTPVQLIILGGLMLVWLCAMLAGAAYIIYYNNLPLQ